MAEKCLEILVREWMKRQPVFSQLHGESFEEAVSCIAQFLREASFREASFTEATSHKVYKLICEALAALDDAQTEAESNMKNEICMVWKRLDDLASRIKKEGE